jgi:hypothetical protein
MDAVKGSCLCGGVTFEIKPPFTVFRYCHCTRCQKVTGSGHAANLFVPETQLAWLTGEALITRFDLPEAKRFAVQFCRRCGTRVPHKARGGDNYVVPAGVLEGDPVMRPENNIYWDSKASWYVEPQEMPKYGERG